MQYEIKQNGTQLTAAVKGRLDTGTAPELEKALKPLLSETEELILDFAELEYISSAGLRVIMQAHMNLRMGGRTRVIHCNAVVKEVFSITGLTNVVSVE